MNKNVYPTNKNYSVGEIASLHARKKIYNILDKTFPLNQMTSILDVGVTADREQRSSNFFEKKYPYTNRITALSDQDASWLEDEYNGIKFIRGDALNMPFNSNSFDLVFSNAVIEHVGDRNNQQRFIFECVRVSNKYIFITTPNRWYPIEFHTILPIIHWLPSKYHRAILAKTGKQFFALESNLNLLSRNDLQRLIPQEQSNSLNHQIKHIRFLGFKSNLLLVIIKNSLIE